MQARKRSRMTCGLTIPWSEEISDKLQVRSKPCENNHRPARQFKSSPPPAVSSVPRQTSSLEEACVGIFEGQRYLAEVPTNLTRQSLLNTGVYWQEARSPQVNPLSALLYYIPESSLSSTHLHYATFCILVRCAANFGRLGGCIRV